MTSEKFKYDPEEEAKEVEPPLDASFYIVFKMKRKAEKGTPEAIDRFVFSDYRLVSKLIYGLCRGRGDWLSYMTYSFEEIEKLKRGTTVEERKKINDEYGFLLKASSQYTLFVTDFIEAKSDINEQKKETLIAISKKKAVELTPLDKLYLKILL